MMRSWWNHSQEYMMQCTMVLLSVIIHCLGIGQCHWFNIINNSKDNSEHRLQIGYMNRVWVHNLCLLLYICQCKYEKCGMLYPIKMYIWFAWPLCQTDNASFQFILAYIQQWAVQIGYSLANTYHIYYYSESMVMHFRISANALKQ